MKKKIKNIILATPPYHSGVLESAGLWPPLGLVYIAGELRKHGYSVEIYDSMSLQHSLEEVREYLRGKEYDMLGVSSITASIVAATEVLKISREEKPSVLTVLGNVHPSFQYDELFSLYPNLIDFIVRGEGEISMPSLLNSLNGGNDLAEVSGIVYKDGDKIITTRPQAFVTDLNILEPAWDLLDYSLYTFYVLPKSRMATINSSRGCPHDCIFCSQQKFWEKSYRELTAEKFVDELKLLSSKFGVNVAMISDEYPTKNGERWEEILDRLIHANMDMSLLMETRVEDILRDEKILWKYRKANILHIYVGVEATNQASLDVFKKDIKCEQSQETLRLIAANGMISECSFVLGMPDETQESIALTLELAKHYNPDFGHFLAITPWPYSDLYKDLKPYIEEWDYSKYNLITPIVKPKTMTLDEINNAIVNCYKEFYMWKVPQFSADTNVFRRDYLLLATRLMMKNSFLKKYMQGDHHSTHHNHKSIGLDIPVVA
jgi:anaerobic magnesium-protoporphyrin IX monomethyl ester cyclase